MHLDFRGGCLCCSWNVLNGFAWYWCFPRVVVVILEVAERALCWRWVLSPLGRAFVELLTLVSSPGMALLGAHRCVRALLEAVFCGVFLCRAECGLCRASCSWWMVSFPEVHFLCFLGGLLTFCIFNCQETFQCFYSECVLVRNHCSSVTIYGESRWFKLQPFWLTPSVSTRMTSGLMTTQRYWLVPASGKWGLCAPSGWTPLPGGEQTCVARYLALSFW